MIDDASLIPVKSEVLRPMVQGYINALNREWQEYYQSFISHTKAKMKKPSFFGLFKSQWADVDPTDEEVVAWDRRNEDWSLFGWKKHFHEQRVDDATTMLRACGLAESGIVYLSFNDFNKFHKYGNQNV